MRLDRFLSCPFQGRSLCPPDIFTCSVRLASLYSHVLALDLDYIFWLVSTSLRTKTSILWQWWPPMTVNNSIFTCRSRIILSRYWRLYGISIVAMFSLCYSGRKTKYFMRRKLIINSQKKGDIQGQCLKFVNSYFDIQGQCLKFMNSYFEC